MATGQHGAKGQMGEKMDGKIEKRAQKAPKRHPKGTFNFLKKERKMAKSAGFVQIVK